MAITTYPPSNRPHSVGLKDAVYGIEIEAKDLTINRLQRGYGYAMYYLVFAQLTGSDQTIGSTVIFHGLLYYKLGYWSGREDTVVQAALGVTESHQH